MGTEKHKNLLRTSYLSHIMLTTTERVHRQHIMCALRDQIAEDEGKDPQQVQEEFETLAAVLRLQPGVRYF